MNLVALPETRQEGAAYWHCYTSVVPVTEKAEAGGLLNVGIEEPPEKSIVRSFSRACSD